MSKFRNFTLEGKAFRVTAHLGQSGGTRYSVDRRPEFDKDDLTYEELCAFAEAVGKDSHFYGVLKDDHITEFEEAWECSTEGP